MEESNQQQQLLLQQQMQHRQQQLFMMQKHQQQAAISRFPTNVESLHRPPGMIQNPNANLIPSYGPSLIQQQQNVSSQQQMKTMMMQQLQKAIRPSNHLEIQFAYQDAWRVCHPDYKRPFASLEDACERLLPYHVVADYEAEEEERLIFDSDSTNETLSRCRQWDNNIATKVEEFTATFEEQVQAFNKITQKRRDGELRSEERLMIEQALLLEERKACIEVKSELDKEMKKAQEAARLRMTGQMTAESQQSHTEMMMARSINPLRANAIGNLVEQGCNMNPDEMMMMNGWVNNNDNHSQRDEKEPLEDFLNDEGNENGETGGEFDLNAL